MKNKVLNLASNLLLLLLGAESIAALIVETFSISVPTRFWIWLGVLCLLLWVASSFRRGILIGMPLCAAVLWYLYRIDEEDLLIEFHDLLEHISTVYVGHFTGSDSVYQVTDQTAGHMTALLFILFLFAAFLSVSLASGSFRISLSLLATVPLFAVCIAVNGKPSVLPVLGVLLFWCGVHLSGDVFRLTDASGKSMLLGLIPCLLVLSCLLLLYNPSNYHYDETDIRLSQRFDSLGNALSKWINRNESSSQGSSGTGETTLRNYEPPAGWRSGTDDLVLTRGFDYSALDKEAFRISSNAVGSLYFRGKSYGEYCGNAWQAAIENTHAHALDYTAYAVQNSPQQEMRSFELQSDVPYDLLYLPYFSISGKESDVKYLCDGSRYYGGEFTRCYQDLAGISRLSLAGDNAYEEKQYRQYAQNYYTRLPDSTRAEVEGICRTLGLSKDLGTAELILAVADTVRSRGIYDINVEPYTGSDYAVDFLMTPHRGYCIHFATAAAVLYRALDIPARVCEGYLVNLVDENKVVVTGKDAHAWVEVYLDGVGWYPIEVTASPADNPDAQAFGTAQAPETPEETPAEPESEDDTDTPITSEEQDDGSADGAQSSGEDSGEGGEASPDGNGGAGTSRTLRTVLRLLWIPAGLLLLAAAVYGRYRLLRSGLRKRLNDTDGRRVAISVYRQADRLRRWGAEMPAVIRATAEKAAFSQHEISREEQKACLSALNRLTNETYQSLTKRGKFAFRYLFGNI